MQRASPLNSGRDRATLSRPCWPLLHPASASCGIARRVFFRFLFRFACPPIYSRFFVVFAYGGRVIMVLYALLDPPSSFLPAKTTSTTIIPIVALSSRSLLPFHPSFFVRFIRAKRSPRPALRPLFFS